MFVRCLLRIVGIAGVVAIACLQHVPQLPGQIRVPGVDAGDPGGMMIPRDRRVQSLLEQAQRELRDPEGDHREALQILQRILDEAEDVFVDPSMQLSLREQASQILASLPESTKQLYQETFGVEAASLLESTDRSGRRSAAQTVVQRFFHTDAGAEAAFRLAAADRDSGRLLRAARLLDRLRSEHDAAGRYEPHLTIRCLLSYWGAGAEERAANLLHEAVQQGAESDLTIAGHRVPELSSSGAARKWLAETLGTNTDLASQTAEQWLMPQGSRQRNASAEPVTPLFDDAWSIPLIRDHDAEDPQQVEELAALLDGVSQSAREADWTTVPVLTPLVVNDLVVFPSYGLIKAVDLSSGRLRWAAVPADQTYLDSLRSSSHSSQRRLSAEMDEFLIQRAWLDATSSQISSDGKRVYCVRDSGMVGGVPPQFARTAQFHQLRGPKSFNSLRAYSATGGNWLWEIGGARTRVSLPLAGSFFLGPPLPVDGTLYVLGEDLGQVRLHALDPESGEVQWSLPLVNAETDIEDNVERRLAGLSPTLAGGLLICPTGGGLIVAVDPLTRSLVWGTRYRGPQDYGISRGLQRRGAFLAIQASEAQIASVNELMETPRWHEGCVVAAGNSLLVAPPDVESPEDEHRLICLDLLNGETQWQRKRQGALYVGAVHRETVVLIGERHVEGASLDNGRTLWSIPLDQPSGRGVRCGNLYHLPLSSGEIATIDLNEGTLLARSPVRSGRTLGNLVATGGRLISQSATEIRSFRPRDEVWEQLTKDLTADPDNPAALAVRGEFRMHDGQLESGLADLRSVLEVSDDHRSRQLLVSTLLEGLRADFAEYRQHVDELDRLTADAAERGRFLSTYAQGLLDANEPVGAFEQYIRLLMETDSQNVFAYVAENRRVRRDRHVQGQLARLYDDADKELRAELDRLIEQHLSAAPDESQTVRREQLALALPHLRDKDNKPPAEPSESASPEWPTKVEARLLDLRSRGDAGQRAAASARLVEFYTRHGRAEPVAQLLAELETVWADTPCRDGKNGAEWAAAARRRDSVSALLGEVVNWPDGEVTVHEGAGNMMQTSPLRFEGPTDPLTSTYLYLTGLPGEQVAIQDGLGRRIKNGLLQMRSAGGARHLDSQYVMQRGHRAVVFLGTQFKLINLIDGQPRVLLDELLVDVEPSANPRFQMMQTRVTRRMGFRGQVTWSDDPGENGSVGPLNDSVFCYLRGNSLHAHDPFTGERYWTVENAPDGAEIFADSDYVLLVPLGQNVVHVYRALDGEKLGVRNLPGDVERDRHGADWGRHFLRQLKTADGARSLAMFDPVSGENVWEKSVPEQFLWSPLDGHDLCVLGTDGQMMLLDAETGRVLQEAEVDVPEGMISMHVHSLPDRWLLTTFRRPAADAQVQLAQIRMSEATYQVVNGPVTAFQRQTGKTLWSRVVESQCLSALLPARWPVLPLSAVVNAMPHLDGQRVRPNLARRILILDKQTGETIHASETEADPRNMGMSWTINEAEPQLQLQLGRTALNLSFREEAPEPSESNEKSSKDSAPEPPTEKPDTDEPAESP